MNILNIYRFKKSDLRTAIILIFIWSTLGFLGYLSYVSEFKVSKEYYLSELEMIRLQECSEEEPCLNMCNLTRTSADTPYNLELIGHRLEEICNEKLTYAAFPDLATSFYEQDLNNLEADINELTPSALDAVFYEINYIYLLMLVLTLVSLFSSQLREE